MNIKCIDTIEIIDYVIIFIQAMLQWTKVSLATLLSTFYCYLAFDDRKCIHYCMHCRKLKCIHYYSFNFRLFTFYYKSDSICKFCTNMKSIHICWYTSSIFLDKKYRNTISWREFFAKLVSILRTWDTISVWAILNQQPKCNTYAYILIRKHNYYFKGRIATSRQIILLVWGG